MADPVQNNASASPHVSVLIKPLVRAVQPVQGVWVDGTFGAGGYARDLLAAGATRVIGIDRDPTVFPLSADWRASMGDRVDLRLGTFSQMDKIVGEQVDGVVLDLGVSSMQIDQAERGFSFQKDGPLDMRMGDTGPTAADLVNTADEEALANILYLYGEERASRRIARAIVQARPIERTLELATIIAGCLPRQKPGQSHPATRSFQALRIAVNDEYRQLYDGLAAAESILKPGGHLAVVTFHSVEDRMVKRFMQLRAGATGGGSRYAPEVQGEAPAFTLVTRKAIQPDDEEVAANPRARSALLRVARRTDAPAGTLDPAEIGMPSLQPAKGRGGRR
ncbi:16S rRNA (cytosine1402-N4)-methyltransferase [Ketogulonicigenium robustum]|uniref:Ribosomal RNA small subunit methyltransferase H n=1 Tax=Ketogulonicigenium robustum TaxID=92947 RepID=A0A1W6P0X1_9RHOB|nr:16S rRNA (cytosine(1402)-N(4))-methyltransferase RsmH [Ketogulonicigenium robustum]ARO14927.1 16S rRNA (cytosine1402-N4)-methyltransferase [Ketogulonicigenium robustum]